MDTELWGVDGIIYSFSHHVQDLDDGPEALTAFLDPMEECTINIRRAEQLFGFSGFVDYDVDMPVLESRARDWSDAVGAFKMRLATTDMLTVFEKARLTTRIDFVNATMAGAQDCLTHIMRFQRFRAAPYIRPAQADWDKLRPLVKKDDKEEKMDWNLALQIYIAAHAQKQGWVLVNGVPYERISGNKHAIRVCEMTVAEGVKQPTSLDELVRREVIMSGVDPQMLTEARKDPGFIEKACSWFRNFPQTELQHVVPSNKFFSFNNGILQIRDSKGEPTLVLVKPEELADGLVCRVHHNYDVSPEFINKPMHPLFCEPGTSKTRSGDSLLKWMVQEPTPEERAAMTTEAAKLDPTYLASDTSVISKVWADQEFSAQQVFLNFGLLGRCFYDNTIDNWQVAPFINGPARAGKNLTWSEVIAQALGEDSVGTVSATRIDTFSFANAQHWKMFILNEIRNGDKLDEGALLRMISGEEVVIRKMQKEPFTLAHCHYHSMFISNELKMPVRSVRGEFAARMINCNFKHSFADVADTTLAAQRRPQIGAIICMAVRCYRVLRAALGRANVKSFLPFDVQKEENELKWHTNLIYQFLSSGDIVINQGVVMTAEKRLEEFVKSPACRERSPYIPITTLGDAFRLWLLQTHPGSTKLRWIPATYNPVFKELGLPFCVEGAGGETFPCEILGTGQQGLASSTSGVHFPHAGCVHFVEIGAELSRRMKEDDNRRKRSLNGGNSYDSNDADAGSFKRRFDDDGGEGGSGKRRKVD